MVRETIHSTWGAAFIKEVEETVTPSLSIWYLGCNGFILRSSNTTVYIDPYLGDGQPPEFRHLKMDDRPKSGYRMIPVPMDPEDAEECDAVLVTHNHDDHFHPPSYGPLLENLGAGIYAPAAAYNEPVPPEYFEDDLRIPEGQQNVIDVGDVLEIGDITVHVCEANDPDATEAVSFVVEHESGTFFHAGDSKPCDDFKSIGEEFDIDIGALAIGSIAKFYLDIDLGETNENDDGGHVLSPKLYMDESEVIQTANDLSMDRLLPTHYDMWKGIETNPANLYNHAATFEYPRNIDLVKIGDHVEMGTPGIRPPNYLR